MPIVYLSTVLLKPKKDNERTDGPGGRGYKHARGNHALHCTLCQKDTEQPDTLFPLIYCIQFNSTPGKLCKGEGDFFQISNHYIQFRRPPDNQKHTQHTPLDLPATRKKKAVNPRFFFFSVPHHQPAGIAKNVLVMPSVMPGIVFHPPCRCQTPTCCGGKGAGGGRSAHGSHNPSTRRNRWIFYAKLKF